MTRGSVIGLRESDSGQWYPTGSSLLAWTIGFGASAGTGMSTRGCGSGLPCLLLLWYQILKLYEVEPVIFASGVCCCLGSGSDWPRVLRNSPEEKEDEAEHRASARADSCICSNVVYYLLQIFSSWFLLIFSPSNWPVCLFLISLHEFLYVWKLTYYKYYFLALSFVCGFVFCQTNALYLYRVRYNSLNFLNKT